jgi:hypothetical protein
MKGIKYIVLVLGLAFVTNSCDTFLEEELVTDVAASSYYTTKAGFEDAVRGTYALLKNFYGPERGWTMTSFGTDNFTNGADGGHKVINFYDGGLNGSHGYFRDTWRDWYKGINQANAVINRSESIEMDAALKAIRIAEARFLRALYYFDLTRTYGDVHLTLEETEGVELEANKTAASEIYSQAIIPDLEFAIANLPEAQSDYGRATKPAAEFLLAKVHLTLSYGSGGAASASTAETLFSNVINNYGFELLPDWGDLWDITNQENSEIVWNLTVSKSQVDAGIDGNGHRAHLYFLMEYDKRRGMTRDIANGRPWKRFRPTPYLLGVFDRSMDERYDKGFKHVWYANKDVSDDRGNLVIGDTAVFIPGPGTDTDWSAAKKDAAPYEVYTSDDYNERIFPSVNKWIDDTRPDRQKTQGQRDVVMMRLGDAYLLRAEARLQKGDELGARADINVIRRRAADVEIDEALMDVPVTTVVDLDFLLDERSRELYAEGHRWWTLARTGKLIERVRLHNPQGAPNIQDYHIVRPIPQQQIDGTIGGYPQNPGYPN